ncbi:hypothetical protein GCM10009112_01670 [Marinomonas arenicola]|uniref:IclR family transcriptional regulator n=1 Tax=Marinomonas TaxID=28253 RepID=UPI001055F2A6|nr:helix-turn-helix domain-containing protein [Marinomonas sp. KMM3893]
MKQIEKDGLTVDASVKGAASGVQSLARGLKVLAAVNEFTPATVTQIVASTGFPKATVIRLLKTLKNEGYIDLNPEAGGYKTLPKVRLLASSMISDNSFAVSARQFLNDFAQILKWPSDLLIAEGSSMVVQASNRDTAPIHIKRFEQGRFSLLLSASGIAYLSALPAKKRQEVVKATVKLQPSSEDLELLTEKVMQEIAHCQQNGFAVTDYHAPIEGTRAVAIPLLYEGEPFGALAMLFIRDAVSDEQLQTFLLPQLRDAAGAVARLYQQHGAGMTLTPVPHEEA